MDTAFLEEIGLTEGEAKVYLALLELGTTATGKLVKQAGISASKVYLILDRLAKKGLVGHVIKGGVRYFQAADPKRILDYLEEREREHAKKKQQVLSLLPQLILKQKLGAKRRKAEIYEGLKGVTNVFRNIFDELKRGEEYYAIGVSYGDQEIPGMRPFFEKFHRERAKRGIKVSCLANASVKNKLVPTIYRLSKIKFLPEELITNVQIMFYHDKTFIILWSKDPMGFLIYNEEIVSSFRQYFDFLWKRASEK